MEKGIFVMFPPPPLKSQLAALVVKLERVLWEPCLAPVAGSQVRGAELVGRSRGKEWGVDVCADLDLQPAPGLCREQVERNLCAGIDGAKRRPRGLDADSRALLQLREKELLNEGVVVAPEADPPPRRARGEPAVARCDIDEHRAERR
jgi:hypothetical protein